MAGVSQPREHRGRVLVEPGSRVEVKTGFDRSWASGFEVLASSASGYLLRRLSDGHVLPRTFPPDDVRPEPHDARTWPT